MTVTSTAPAVSGTKQRLSSSGAKRINVAVNPDMVRALENVIEAEGVSLTEAVRRLIGYGDFVYRAVKQNHSELLVRNPRTEDTQQVLLV